MGEPVRHFRHRLEAPDLPRDLFEEIGGLLGEKKRLLRAGTRMDASLIAAPSSTQNARRGRDPQRHQAKKGNPWYFGMKAHPGADAASGLVPSVVRQADCLL